MRFQLLLLLLLLLALGLAGCDAFSPAEPPAPAEVGLHVQATFDRDFLAVWVDDVPVFADTVTTFAPLGLAASSSLTLPAGRRHVRAELNGRLHAETTFRTDRTRILVVGYDRARDRLSVAATNQRLSYY